MLRAENTLPYALAAMLRKLPFSFCLLPSALCLLPSALIVSVSLPYHPLKNSRRRQTKINAPKPAAMGRVIIQASAIP